MDEHRQRGSQRSVRPVCGEPRSRAWPSLRAALFGTDETGAPNTATPAAARRIALGAGVFVVVLAIIAIIAISARFSANAVWLPILAGFALLWWVTGGGDRRRAFQHLLVSRPGSTPAVTDTDAARTSGRAERRWLRTCAGLIGPGSSPLALLLWITQLLLIGGAGYRISPPTIGPIAFSEPAAAAYLAAAAAGAAAASVVVAAYRPLSAWVVILGAFWLIAQASEPTQLGWGWPWMPPLLVSYLLVQYAVARAAAAWLVLPTLLGTVGLTIEIDAAYPPGNVADDLLVLVPLATAAVLAGGLPRLRSVRERRAQRGSQITRYDWDRVVAEALLGPTQRHRRLWHPASLARLIGPGSIPLAVVLWSIQTQLTRTDYEVVANYSGSAATTVAIVQSLTVVIAAYRPVFAWGINLFAFWLTAGFVEPGDPTKPWPWLVPMLLGHLLIQYAVARRSQLWVAMLAWVGTAVLTMYVPEVLPSGTTYDTSGNVVLVTLLSALAALTGFTQQLRQRAHTRVWEEERVAAEERARREMLEDRARIARELHDVVAHHMSVITVQCSTAEYRIPELPDQAREEFATIGVSARESLTEMRRLLGLLRADGSQADRAPQPSLDQVEPVVEGTRRAGTPVEVTREGMPERVPPSVDLTAYRIVQEGLSNVVRHAPGASTAVELCGTTEELLIRVRNEAPPQPLVKAPVALGGHGLIGMRERVHALGGRLVVGPRTDGGFAVEASLPWAGGDADHEMSGIVTEQEQRDHGTGTATVADTQDEDGTRA